jgi:hypothetical protein
LVIFKRVFVLPRQLDSDTFTYSNGSLDAASNSKWSTPSGEGSMQVSGNAITSASIDAWNFPTTWLGSLSNHWSQVKATTVSSDGGGPAVRLDAVNNGYAIHMNGTPAYELLRFVGGTATSIASGGTPANGDIIYLEVQGYVFTFKQNGTTVFTFTETDATVLVKGKPGVYGFDAIHVLDNWTSGDFGGGFYISNNVIRQRVPQ